MVSNIRTHSSMRIRICTVNHTIETCEQSSHSFCAYGCTWVQAFWGHSFSMYAYISMFWTPPPPSPTPPLYAHIMTSLWKQYIGVRLCLPPPAIRPYVLNEWPHCVCSFIGTGLSFVFELWQNEPTVLTQCITESYVTLKYTWHVITM